MSVGETILGAVLGVAFVFLAFLLAGISFGCIIHKYEDKPSKSQSLTIPEFNVAQYLERIEKVSDNLLRQHNDSYTLILWAGLDGLKMNPDGSTKWIRKRATVDSMWGASDVIDTTTLGDCCYKVMRDRVLSPINQFGVSYISSPHCDLQFLGTIDSVQNANTMSLQNELAAQMANCTMTINANIMDEARALDGEIHALRLQVAQQERNAHIINSLCLKAPEHVLRRD